MILIDESIKNAVGSAALAVVECQADVAETGGALLDEFNALAQKLAVQYADSALIAQNPHIAATRAAYRALGKDPTRHRNSAEAMLRRLSQGKGLYHINAPVDINNMISTESAYSLGSYDLAAVSGNITWKRAPDGESYRGIGKDDLNLEHLPALYDDLGIFGNPTSDSRRTMIETGGRKHLLYVIYSFDGAAELPLWSDKLCDLLTRHCAADILNRSIIG